jgi:hypothetical protein
MRVKGVSLIGTLKSLETLHGAAAREAAVVALKGELAEQVRGNALLSAGWYPLEWLRQVHAAAQTATGRGPQLARELSREATLADFRGIYKLLTFVLSPQGIVRKAPSTWSRYYDGGRLEVVEARAGFASARFIGCEGFDRNLWEDSIGGCVGVLEACGASDPFVTVLRGGRDGDDGMDIEVRWRAR